MPPYLGPLLALGGFLLGCAGFFANRRDRFGDHWRTEAAALLDENERLRARMDDLEKDCTTKLQALRDENDALGQRIVQLVKTGRIGGTP